MSQSCNGIRGGELALSDSLRSQSQRALCVDVYKLMTGLRVWFVMTTFGCLRINVIDVADAKESRTRLVAFFPPVSLFAPSEIKHLYTLVRTVCCELFGFPAGIR